MRHTLIAASLLAALAAPADAVILRTLPRPSAATRPSTSSRSTPSRSRRGAAASCRASDYAATSPAATGARKLDVAKPESKAYLAHLDGEHGAFLAAASQVLGRPVAAKFDYTVARNGMALELDGRRGGGAARAARRASRWRPSASTAC